MDNPFYKSAVPTCALSRKIRSVLRPLALLACVLWQGGAARAQGATAQPEPLVLRISPLLQENLGEVQREGAPTFLTGDQVSGQQDTDMRFEGHVMLRRGDTVIRADSLSFDQAHDLARAQGNVHLNQAGNVFEGPRLELRIDAFEGFLDRAQYYLLYNDAYGEAARVDFLDPKRAVVRQATFTTCKREPGPDWLPDWLLHAASLTFDGDEQTADGEDVAIDFKQTQLLHVSSLSFPISGARKTGFLAPAFGADNISGTVVTAPFYWNIAPNRDLTLYPSVMSARGVNLDSDFRYLETDYNGRWRLDYMPQDQLRGMDRWGASIVHTQVENTDIGRLGLSLNLNRVSDDNYWRDFPSAAPTLTQRLLSNDVQFNWGQGPYSAMLRSQTWQTLQDPLSPIVPPYDRSPELAAKYAVPDSNGFDVQVDSDFTSFLANSTLTGQPNAQRGVLHGQVSYPMVGGPGFIIPKASFNAASYEFDAPLSSGQMQAGRTVPTVSLDSGLVFERDASYFGSAYRQTLEPRLFYVYTPFVDQNYLPNYDSGLMDFSFGSIYTENPYVGNDRIADNNLLTAGVSSRLLDPTTGAEIMRLGIAQRYRYQTQQITLPGGTPEQAGLSDILLGAGLNLDPRWYFDSTVQYNLSTGVSTRSTYTARYNPTPYRVLNMAYLYQQNSSEQMDVSWQWPLNDLWGDSGQDLGPGQGQGPGRWYSVARFNYSMQEGQMVDSVLGLEYDAGCWIGRMVFERLTTGLASATQIIMFQLEFVGFSRLGIDPLQALRTSIPRYQLLRDQISPASRFSNYD